MDFRDWLLTSLCLNETILNFGKYNGQDHTKVPAYYLRWMLDNVNNPKFLPPQLRQEIEARLGQSAPQQRQIVQPAQPAASAQRQWIVANVISNDNGHGLPTGTKLTLAKRQDGNWDFVADNGKTGIFPNQGLNLIIKSLRDANNQPITQSQPLTKGDDRVAGMQHNTMNAQPKPKILTDEQLGEEGLAIDKRFEKMMTTPGQDHMAISALAGTGKTTQLKHLAHKYGRPGQQWLYLVFGTKNKVDATGEFPQFVQVKTTNGFLGEILKSKENITRIKQTDRVANLAGDGGRKLEKIKLLVDGPQFSALMKQSSLPDPDRVSDNKLSKLLKSMRFEFKQNVIKLADLSKAFAVDPRKTTEIKAEIDAIIPKYDLDFDLSEIKERLQKSDKYGILTDQISELIDANFMTKSYVQEAKNAVVWVLQNTMPHGTDQEYGDRTKHNLGEFRDFSDDLWFAAVHANELHWPKFDVVLADEVQDFNKAQRIILNKLIEAGAKVVTVGDKNQCHPAGTMVAVTGGGYKKIEELNVGDQVVSYNSKESYFPGTNTQGRKVLNVAKRPYDGDLVVIKTTDNLLKCTPNHKCLVKLNNKDSNKYCLYLMIKNENARIGICRLNYRHGFGLSIRSHAERADFTFLLDVFNEEKEARIAECVCAYKFGIPQLIFVDRGQRSTDQEYINEVYSRLGNNIENAKMCVKYFNREWDFPIWRKVEHENFIKLNKNYIGSNKSFVTQACNLISGAMVVRTFDHVDKRRGGSWEVATIYRETANCDVYSLEVEPAEDGRKLYIANNIVTHNSLYRFRGAESTAMDNIHDSLKGFSQDKDVGRTLTRNWRSEPEIIDFINQHTKVKNLQAGKPRLGKGVATMYEKKYNEAFETLQQEANAGKIKETAFISRTNEPLVHAALKLMKQGTPFVILGKDIASDLLKHIDKILNFMKLRDQDSADDLLEKLEQFLDREQESNYGKASKAAYMSDLTETTHALVATLEEFEGTIGQYKMWLKSRLTGIDTDNENDYKKLKSSKPSVILTTSHKSKGLEFDRVFILRNDRFPHPRATLEDDLEQEENSKFVAYSRPKDEIHVLELEGQPGYEK